MTNLIDPKYQDLLGGEDYSKKVTIDGVKVVELKKFVTEDGYFLELSRPQQGILKEFAQEGFEAKQINYSKSAPQTVKGWHIHENQEDVWFVTPDSKFLVGLADLRAGSPTKDKAMRLVLGEGKAHLVYIPRGVAHGYRNLQDKDGSIIYFVNSTFNPDAPDEKRLAWNAFGEDFWEIKKG